MTEDVIANLLAALEEIKAKKPDNGWTDYKAGVMAQIAERALDRHAELMAEH